MVYYLGVIRGIGEDESISRFPFHGKLSTVVGYLQELRVIMVQHSVLTEETIVLHGEDVLTIDLYSKTHQYTI